MPEKQARLKALEKELTKPSFWQDPQKAKEVTSELKSLKETVLSLEKILESFSELKDLHQLTLQEKDESLNKELGGVLRNLAQNLKAFELKSLFQGEFDSQDAILSIHPGAGGTESQDWAEMLLRMYLRWAEKKGYRGKINDLLPGEEAGLKRVTLTIFGEYAYGFLKAEKGVHRLVRISPFDAAKRRHTSFASVDIIPAIPEEAEVVIEPKELRIETYRSSGPGGQHVNVTDSAVRITHLPTRITAQCQSERSQLRNKEGALKILKARLFQKKQAEKEEDLRVLRGEQKEIAWGSQIRSYILHPYQMVKDHRLGLEKGNALAVLDGEIDEFISAYHHLKQGE